MPAENRYPIPGGTMPEDLTVPDHLTLWVCTDCYFAYHNGDYNRTDDMDTQPFALYDLADGSPTMDDRGFSSGLFAGEHAEDCAFRTSNGEQDCTWDGECEQITFSRASCDTCGTHLAGTRHAMTKFDREEQ